MSVVYLGIEMAFSEGSKTFSGVFNKHNLQICYIEVIVTVVWHWQMIFAIMCAQHNAAIIVKDVPNLFIADVTLGSRITLSGLCG